MVEVGGLKGLFLPQWLYDLVFLWFYSIILENRTWISYECQTSFPPSSQYTHTQTHTHSHTGIPSLFFHSYMKQAGRGKHNPSGTKLGSRKRKQQCLKVCLKCLPIPEHKYSVFKYKTEINENCDMTIDDDIEQIHSLNRIWK